MHVLFFVVTNAGIISPAYMHGSIEDIGVEVKWEFIWILSNFIEGDSEHL